jgi:hypothetical protein
VPLGIFEGGEQVANPEDERYRAIEVGFLGQFPKPGELPSPDPRAVCRNARSVARGQALHNMDMLWELRKDQLRKAA